MKQRNWRRPEDYVYTEVLEAGQWAWEFLRRNNGYQKDWQWFYDRWQTLEARYGKPPERDFQRWKKDPLAYRKMEDADGDCQVEQDSVLIECWMGTKWGFYKFPLDPATERPRMGEQLSWRELEESVHMIEGTGSSFLDGHTGKIALGFDLGLPLRSQLESAKRFLQMRQARLRREGSLALQTIDSHRDRWTLMLRLLDGLQAGESLDDIHTVLGHEIPEQDATTLLTEAEALVNGGYREILRLPGRRQL